MSEPFLGEIRIFAGNFAPSGWAQCQGQLLAIAQNTALFALLGTSYGGDGRTTFGLPNFQGNAPLHWGRGAGLSQYDVGQRGGSTTAALTDNPAHNHIVSASAASPDQSSPQGNVLADATVCAAAPFPVMLAPATVQATGGNQPHNNMQPYLGMTFIIALQGMFPTRP